MTSRPDTKVLAIPSAGTYRMDGVNSAITYTSRHMFGLAKVRAKLSIASGQLEIGESLADCHVTATIDAASFRSENAKRDSDVKGPGLLDAANFPHIDFISTGMRKDERGMVLVGTVAMHGVVTSVQLPVSSWKPNILTASECWPGHPTWTAIRSVSRGPKDGWAATLTWTST